LKKILVWGLSDLFAQVQEELRLAQQREYEAQQKQIAHMEAFVDRFYNEKRSAAQVCCVALDPHITSY
jgi:hypothetical protein